MRLDTLQHDLQSETKRLTAKFTDKYTQLGTAMAEHTNDIRASHKQIKTKLTTMEDNMQELMNMCEDNSTHWDQLLTLLRMKHNGLRDDFDQLILELNHTHIPLRHNTTSAMDVRTQVPTSSTCTHAPSRWHVTVDERTFDSRYATPHVYPPVSPSNVGSLRSRDRHITGLPLDLQLWHGRGDLDCVADGCLSLSKDNLHKLEILDEYHGAILDTHDNLTLSEKLRTHPDTRGALKHPAWDRLSDTTPEGWMEFYKSL
jgi:hypothetical protein